jgi:CrcB protein
VAVFFGGCLGGYLRYAVTRAWPAAAGHFPWSTLVVNVAGAFVLTVVIIIAAEVAPSRYLRPLLGTGFCGGLTTFSSVVVATDRLVAHQHAVTGVAYLLVTIVTGLVAGWSGLVTGRAVAANHRRTHQTRSAS